MKNGVNKRNKSQTKCQAKYPLKFYVSGKLHNSGFLKEVDKSIQFSICQTRPESATKERPHTVINLRFFGSRSILVGIIDLKTEIHNGCNIHSEYINIQIWFREHLCVTFAFAQNINNFID